MYDGFLSYLDVNHSALLADLATTESERAHYSLYNAIFSCLGSLSVFVSFALWDPQHVAPFQTLCVVMALIAALGFYACGLILE